MRQITAVMLLSTGLLTPLLASAAGDGLRLSPSADPWPQWQARLSVMAQPVSAATGLGHQLQLGAARLAGDRYFGWSPLGDAGGLRATSALLLGPSAQAMAVPSIWQGGALRTGAWSGHLNSEADASQLASAYLGLGYSAWWARSGLGLSADLGLIAQRPGGLRLNRSEPLDSAWRGLQMSPVLQVNLSYAF